MKGQKNRKNPTCSRCRFHDNKDIRVLQHKCPYKDCPCSNCLLVKRRSTIYRTQKTLDKQDENSNGGVSSPSSGSSGSGGCVGSPHISMHPQNAENVSNNGHNSWIQSSTSNPILTKNVGYSKIQNFQTLCLTFPDYSPSQLQSLFEQCGNDFEKTIDKILITKWYNDQSVGNECPTVNNEQPPASNEYQYNCEDSRSSFSNSYYTPTSQRMVSSNEYSDQEYVGDQMSNIRSYNCYNSINTTSQNNEWNYGDNSSNYQNGWTSNDYYNWTNNSNVWNSGSYSDQNVSGLDMNYDRPVYPRQDYEYQDNNHYESMNLIGSRCNISSSLEFDS